MLLRRSVLRPLLPRLSRSLHNERELNESLRNAHATEIFRAAFLDGSSSANRVSPADLDDLLVSRCTRPSLLIGAYGIGGFALGALARLAPTPVAQTVSTMVNDATLQQFNDCIRDVQQRAQESEGVEDMDIKETVKYHRDIDINLGANSKAASEKKEEIDGTAIALSTVLYNCLKLSRKI